MAQSIAICSTFFVDSLVLLIIVPLVLYPVPVISNVVPFANVIFLAVCSFTVRVPVLSLAITVQLPRDSTEFNFFYNDIFLLILFEAIVRAIVRAKLKPSGIADTANATTDKNIAFTS